VSSPDETRIGKARVTINDVARATGLPKSAVSLALNNKPGVSASRRERILETAQHMAWQPSTRARSLSTSRAYALAFVAARSPEVLAADPFFAQFLAGVERTLSARGYALMLQMVGSPEEEVAAYERLAEQRLADGVILGDVRTSDTRIPLLAALGLAAVCLGTPRGANPFPVLELDDAAGVAAAVDLLASQGHRRIAHVSGPLELVHATRRKAAWRAALRRQGLAAAPCVTGDFGVASGASATRRLLGSADPPTAILYANDLMAVGGLNAAEELGVHVPGRLSIVGFDDIPLAPHLSPPLTTIGADYVAWGATAAALLLRELGDMDPGVPVAPHPRLVIRGSAAPRRE